MIKSTKQLRHVIVLLLIQTCLSSCFRTMIVNEGNSYSKCIGKTKNQILRTYGVPDKTTDDGAGGSVLVWEQRTLSSSGSSSSNSQSNSNSDSRWNLWNNSLLGSINSRDNSSTFGSFSSNSVEGKNYLNIFFDKNDVAYDYTANIGDIYNKKRFFRPIKSWIWVTVFGLVYPPSLLVTGPVVGFITYRSIKKHTIIIPFKKY